MNQQDLLAQMIAQQNAMMQLVSSMVANGNVDNSDQATALPVIEQPVTEEPAKELFNIRDPKTYTLSELAKLPKFGRSIKNPGHQALLSEVIDLRGAMKLVGMDTETRERLTAGKYNGKENSPERLASAIMVHLAKHADQLRLNASQTAVLPVVETAEPAILPAVPEPPASPKPKAKPIATTKPATVLTTPYDVDDLPKAVIAAGIFKSDYRLKGVHALVAFQASQEQYANTIAENRTKASKYIPSKADGLDVDVLVGETFYRFRLTEQAQRTVDRRVLETVLPAYITDYRTGSDFGVLANNNVGDRIHRHNLTIKNVEKIREAAKNFTPKQFKTWVNGLIYDDHSLCECASYSNTCPLIKAGGKNIHGNVKATRTASKKRRQTAIKVELDLN